MVPKYFAFAFLLLPHLSQQQTAAPVSLLTGQKCSNTTDCDHSDVFCNVDNHCECKLGFQPTPLPEPENPELGDHFFGKRLFPTQCTRFECSNDSDCQTRFGAEHSYCTEFNDCDCPNSFHYSEEARDCVTNATKLNEQCSSWRECGKYASCKRYPNSWHYPEPDVNGTCVCTIGFKPVSDYGCDLNICHKDSDCSSVQDHTICKNELCYCDEASGYEKNDEQSNCRRKPKNLGEHCDAKDNCGYEASCIEGVCKCHMGYVKAGWNSVDCEQKTCSRNDECEALDPNSWCNAFALRCFCKSDVEHDYGKLANPKTQRCDPAKITTMWPTL